MRLGIEINETLPTKVRSFFFRQKILSLSKGLKTWVLRRKNKYWKIIFYGLLLFSVLHLIRDILQIFQIETLITTSLNTNKNWCNPYCDYVTIPPEVLIIIFSIIILLRNQLGKLGLFTLIIFFLWSLFFLVSLVPA